MQLKYPWSSFKVIILMKLNPAYFKDKLVVEPVSYLVSFNICSYFKMRRKFSILLSPKGMENMSNFVEIMNQLMLDHW